MPTSGDDDAPELVDAKRELLLEDQAAQLLSEAWDALDPDKELLSLLSSASQAVESVLARP